MAPDTKKKSVAKNSKAPDSVEAYLASVPTEALPALKALRAAIKAAAPDAEEIISYGVPTYRQRTAVVSFSATAKHCAFYVMSPKPIARRKNELEEYDLAPTAIRFSFEQRLPKTLVTAIVRERLEENAMKARR